MNEFLKAFWNHLGLYTKSDLDESFQEGIEQGKAQERVEATRELRNISGEIADIFAVFFAPLPLEDITLVEFLDKAKDFFVRIPPEKALVSVLPNPSKETPMSLKLGLDPIRAAAIKAWCSVLSRRGVPREKILVLITKEPLMAALEKQYAAYFLGE